MRKFLALGVVVFAAAAALQAAPIACPTTATLADLIALGASGCQSQDKIFNNFSYSSSGVSAANIGVNLVLQTGVSDIHGWSFVPTTAWTSGFSLSYTISVAPGFPNVGIVGSKDQMNSGFRPNGVTASDVQTGVTPNPIFLSGGVGGTETAFSNPYVLLSVTTTTTAVVASGSNLLSYEQDWFETSTIPEPVSFVLIGSGLLGLAFLRRRLNKS